MNKVFTSALAFVFICALHSLAAAADTLRIDNNTNRELLDILAQPGEGAQFFLRLDLQPGASSSFDNPGMKANIRVDTGLELLYYKNIDFGQINNLIFEHDCAIKLEGPDIKKIQFPDQTISLVPQKGEKPVCELSNFKPKMPMSEVCSIIPQETPRDDNGALLAGLGFGGLIWAGRLAPKQDYSGEKDILLEHMELRREFAKEDLTKLLDHLATFHYVPWQCEFPHAMLDFADMPDKNQSDRMKSLQDVIARYLAAPNGKRGEATIMLAPENILTALENADAPEKDVQLYTIVLKPDANLLMVDVAAYEAQKGV